MEHIKHGPSLFQVVDRRMGDHQVLGRWWLAVPRPQSYVIAIAFRVLQGYAHPYNYGELVKLSCIGRAAYEDITFKGLYGSSLTERDMASQPCIAFSTYKDWRGS